MGPVVEHREVVDYPGTPHVQHLRYGRRLRKRRLVRLQGPGGAAAVRKGPQRAGRCVVEGHRGPPASPPAPLRAPHADRTPTVDVLLAQLPLHDQTRDVQVGSAFAFCEESGLDPSLRERLRNNIRAGQARVFTDPQASPTGFPFKVVDLEGTLSDASVYEARGRHCDLGYLREIYRRPDGALGYRCPAEPTSDYVRKGGRLEDTLGRKCICNGPIATIGLAQRRKAGIEPPIVTAGDEPPMLAPGGRSYTADDVATQMLPDL
jgi:hypothetical protein